jgi:hypothetical protein
MVVDLIIATEIVFEMSAMSSTLTWMIIQEDFGEFGHYL